MYIVMRTAEVANKKGGCGWLTGTRKRGAPEKERERERERKSAAQAEPSRAEAEAGVSSAGTKDMSGTEGANTKVVTNMLSLRPIGHQNVRIFSVCNQ
jgi:hypothetical protein